MTSSLPWSTQPAPAPWRCWLAAHLHRIALALTRQHHAPAAAPPHIEFEHGELYADGVRIGTLPVTRL
ncbi:MAG: hypothetical protein LCH73_14915 [Proteobacteria bacterium]|nr:hypothetical protein [Pseudomonadota bacterium]